MTGLRLRWLGMTTLIFSILNFRFLDYRSDPQDMKDETVTRIDNLRPRLLSVRSYL